MARILVVEKEAIVAYDLMATLEHIGHEVVGIADNAKDALEIGQRKKPEIVFMDMKLKGKVSGLEFVESSCMEAGCKIIFMTGGFVSKETFKRIEKYAMLKKPFDESDIKCALELV